MNKPVIMEFRDPKSGERCVRIDHPSGLPIFVCPKPGYQSAYAVFAVKYGSVDTTFVEDGREVEVPEGIAHYLEHKLFENEDCDAFERYAHTGASANAYTSFERTAYLFNCTGRLEESLEILLDFVQRPYFTEETVRKEQGIIGQEIRMCEDSPNRRVLFNLLKALYQNCPVRVDIAGTVESIAEITPELLYSCYRSFYNLRNMVLVVAGNVDTDTVLRVADRVLIPAPEWNLERGRRRQSRFRRRPPGWKPICRWRRPCSIMDTNAPCRVRPIVRQRNWWRRTCCWNCWQASPRRCMPGC